MSIKLSEDQVDFKRHAYPPNAEINVTPFVDIMLVLLIIFMVAAPIATVTIPVELPINTQDPTPPPTEPVTVTVQANGSVFVNEIMTTVEGFDAAILTATAQNRETQILLRGDRQLQYGRLMEVMDQLSRNGYGKVGLVTNYSERP